MVVVCSAVVRNSLTVKGFCVKRTVKGWINAEESVAVESLAVV